MLTLRTPGLILVVLALAVVGCTSPSAPSAQDGNAVPSGPGPMRTLVMAINSEVSNLSPKAVQLESPGRTTRIFNAELTILDAQDTMRPDLAEALPQLNTDTWRVFPDGRMETTWKLRPGLTWHDGRPLTAEDFAFAFRVYRVPELSGVWVTSPQNLIERVDAVDPRTVRIAWRSPFLHQGEGLNPLPRHLLAEPFAALGQDPGGQRDAFMSLRYWTTEYVGAGPFRLTTWELGSHYEGEAFDGHALGRPKIDRIVIRIIDNTNTVLSNLMAGEIHLSLSQGILFEHAVTLARQYGFNEVERKGTIVALPQSTSTLAFQHRPEHVQTLALLDVRVRRAIAHATDREAINERLFENYARVPVSFAFPQASYYAEVDRATIKYPYDPRRAEQLMGEAGLVKDRDGFFASASGARFQVSLYSNADTRDQIVSAILLDTWKGAGIDAQPSVLSAVLRRDLETLSLYPGTILQTAGGNGLSRLDSKEIASPANRWGGANRGGWSSPDFDVLLERYNSTLDVAEQTRTFVQMMRIYSEQVPTYPLHFNVQVVAHMASVKGPEETRSWNVHQWEFAP